jgi:lysophospholipase L1-like esterase
VTRAAAAAFLLLAASTPLLAREPRMFGDAGAPLEYVVLGDSTAAGVGADYESGIAVGTATELGRTRRVTMTNFGVSGARVRDVVRDQLDAAVARKPELVLLAVTPNDVTHLTCIRSMRRDLETIVTRLRAANPHVAIVVTGSADMSAPPRIPRLLRPVAGWRTRAVNRMVIDVAAKRGLTFAPIARETGPLFHRDPTLFDTDGFHPNARGYAAWRAVLNPALHAALAQ